MIFGLVYFGRIGLLACLLLFSAQMTQASTCAECVNHEKEVSSVKAQINLHKNMLQKNQDYLAKLGPNDASKSIKVKSNILVFVMRIETFNNNLTALTAKNPSLTCSGCGVSFK